MMCGLRNILCWIFCESKRNRLLRNRLLRNRLLRNRLLDQGPWKGARLGIPQLQRKLGITWLPMA